MTLLILDSKNRAKSEDFTIEYSTPLNFKKIALESFSMWVSWNNINKKYGNNTLWFFNGGHWSELTIPDGNYTLRELNNYLVNYFRTNEPPIKFGALFARQRIVIELKENYKINLSKSKLHEILGFEPKIYEDTENEGKFVANISRGIDDIHIHCSIIEGAYLNRFKSEIIHSFTPSNPPGSLIAKNIDKPVFFPVKYDDVYRIRMWVTNQDGELIDLNNQRVLYRLLIDGENYLKKMHDMVSNFLLNK